MIFNLVMDQKIKCYRIIIYKKEMVKNSIVQNNIFICVII